jgi:cobalt-zinc-cadmium efflux system outer membrane protein
MRRALRETFYGLIAADERLQISEAVLDIARRLAEATQARFDAGAAPRLEVLQAGLGVTRAETDVELSRSVRAAAQASLNAVLNLPPDQAVVLSGTLSDHRSAITYPQALALATASNTDLVGLDRQLAVEDRHTALLRAERLPTPVFSFRSLFNGSDFDVTQGAAVSIEVPLFSRNQGDIAGSLATSTTLRLQRDATRRTLENSVFGTVAKIDAERQQVDAYERRLVPTATDLETLAEDSYRAGRTSVLAVLDAQRSLRDLRRDALQAALDLQMLLADLEELLGTPLP